MNRSIIESLNRKNNIIDGRDNIIKTEDEHDQ
jgi:hypothetical protein